MSRVICVHEYRLKSGADELQFENAVKKAKECGLLHLPGLSDYYLVKGIRGSRTDNFAAVWIYESLEAWENLWGPVDKPCDKKDYPPEWKVWEKEILSPFLAEDPDTIRYTSYREL